MQNVGHGAGLTTHDNYTVLWNFTYIMQVESAMTSVVKMPV